MESLASQIIRRQFWTIIFLILCLVVSNGIWIWYINQFDFTTKSVEQEANYNENASVTQNGFGA